METFGGVVQAIVDWLKIDFTLYGYTFSLWTVLVYGLLASFVLWVVIRIFDFGG